MTSQKYTYFLFPTAPEQEAAIDHLLSIDTPFVRNYKFPFFIRLTAKEAKKKKNSKLYELALNSLSKLS